MLSAEATIATYMHDRRIHPISPGFRSMVVRFTVGWCRGMVLAFSHNLSPIKNAQWFARTQETGPVPWELHIGDSRKSGYVPWLEGRLATI